MTRREQLERKAERRREWAGSRDRKAAGTRATADGIAAGMTPGQPILVGHHSEGRHRRAFDRMHNAMRRTFEHDGAATNHREKAAGIEAQLDHSIFSDDPNALEALAERIGSLERKRGRLKALGAAWRKAKKPEAADLEGWQRIAAIVGCDIGNLTEARANCAREILSRGPVPGYVLTNLGGNIRRLKKRLEDVERRQDRTEKADEAGGVLIENHGEEWCSVTFSEKPDREVLTALKAAGFRWSSGSWYGKQDNIPDEVRTSP